MRLTHSSRFFQSVLALLVLGILSIPALGQNASAPISMEFRDAMTLDILKIIAHRAGLNLMIGGKAARRPVTVRFTDVSVSEALAGIASSAGLEQRQIGSITVFCEPEKLGALSPATLLPAASPVVPNPISMDFRDVDIRDLLRLVSRKTGQTIIPQKAVRGNLSCRLTNVDGTNVAQAVALAAGCDFAQDGSALLIADPGHLDEMRVFAGPAAVAADSGTATLDLAVVDLDLRLAMNLAALACGRDFLATPEIRGNVTLAFQGLPEHHLMHLLARSQGFAAAEFGALWVLSSPMRMTELASPPVWPPAVTVPWEPAPGSQSTSLSPGDWDPLINLEFRDAAVRDILTLSARRGNKPLRFPPSLVDRLTIRLSGAPVTPVIRLLCRVCRLTFLEDRTGMTVEDGTGTNAFLTIEPDICPTCPRHPSDPPKSISDSERVAAEIHVGGATPSSGGGAIRILATARGRNGSYALAVAGGALKTLEPGTELFDRQIVNRIATDAVEFVDKHSRVTFQVRLGE